MIVALYKSNRKSDAEQIRVHQYSDGKLHVEAVRSFYAHEVGSEYDTLEEVEQYLKKRDCVFGYTLIIKR